MLVIYDGSFDGWLCAVSDVNEYKFQEVRICAEHYYRQQPFEPVHYANNNAAHSEGLWNCLRKKLSAHALRQLYMAFLTEAEGIETSLLQYVQYALESKTNIESDFSHPSILTISYAAKKAHREKHRMEAFVQFQKTKDELYYAVIEPDFNVLPLISKHFQKRYADQQWLIYDAKRTYGLYYDLTAVSNIEINFAEETTGAKNIAVVAGEEDEMYQKLGQQYFQSANNAAGKNTKLHIRHMPERYWKYLPEKFLC